MNTLKYILIIFFLMNLMPGITAQDTLVLENGKTLIVEIERIDASRFYYKKNNDTKSISKSKVKQVIFSAGWKVSLAEKQQAIAAADSIERAAALETVKKGIYIYIAAGPLYAFSNKKMDILVNISPTIQLPNGMVYSFQYVGGQIPSFNLPSDHSGAHKFYGTPGDKIDLFGLGVGKVFYTKSPYFRYMLEGKINVSRYAAAVYTKRTDIGIICPFCVSHKTTYPQKEVGVGISIKATITLFTKLHVMGISYFTEAHINTKRSFFGLGFSFDFGKVRNRNPFFSKKKKKKKSN